MLGNCRCQLKTDQEHILLCIWLSYQLAILKMRFQFAHLLSAQNTLHHSHLSQTLLTYLFSLLCKYGWLFQTLSWRKFTVRSLLYPITFSLLFLLCQYSHSSVHRSESTHPINKEQKPTQWFLSSKATIMKRILRDGLDLSHQYKLTLQQLEKSTSE